MFVSRSPRRFENRGGAAAAQTKTHPVNHGGVGELGASLPVDSAEDDIPRSAKKKHDVNVT